MLTAIATAVDEPLTFAEREVPQPGPGEVLVKITAGGVCYPDLDVLRGHWPARFPVVPGHEIGRRDANAALDAMAKGHGARRSVSAFG